MAHICKEGTTCTCSIIGLEPNEECPVHGGGIYPPRCESCGKFIRRNYERSTVFFSEMVRSL